MMENQRGTAGAPILGLLQKTELVNVLVVVTRYFGGVLLGTGGLVKAYSEAASLAIQSGKIVKRVKGYVAEVTLEYQKQGEFEYICENNNIIITSKEFTDKIKNLIEISEEKYVELFGENGKTDTHNLPITIKEIKYIIKA